ncbi:uncharacterized protein LOC110710681 [Chenopodium quinoa]|uniref:uncharacterized protein LOC110710681 n=1 Tax=Chenopodium quinoa TaxID=63459 RepID=UPI000B76CEC9|nr:uncharacterized protein LOC110710681 [Chenopodium quinoa]XP_021744703.1 uncharacterized protein LOC110710681 [Chenopodium quinoa]XP_021744704.1 uncharacterized protein LOC110710681 [Chenopodium quinoa]
MEKSVETAIPGTRHSNLKKSFKHCLGFLLTAFPFEDFCRAFPRFTGAEHDRLYQRYIQVITSLHEYMQDEFDLICHETQVGTTLDTVEHLVEQQNLDPLFSKKTNLVHLKHDLLATKENEVQALEELLDKVEDQKHKVKAQIKLLKKKHEASDDTSGPTETIEKLRSMMVSYGSYCDKGNSDHR